MRTILELLRIILIFGILGAIGWKVTENIYTINEPAESYSWLGAVAIFVLLFVLYKNKFQFAGWYKGEGRKKLSRKVSVTLISVSILMVISPFLLGSLFN